jgi:hypothetical protein
VTNIPDDPLLTELHDDDARAYLRVALKHYGRDELRDAWKEVILGDTD